MRSSTFLLWAGNRPIHPSASGSTYKSSNDTSNAISAVTATTTPPYRWTNSTISTSSAATESAHVPEGWTIRPSGDVVFSNFSSPLTTKVSTPSYPWTNATLTGHSEATPITYRPSSSAHMPPYPWTNVTSSIHVAAIPSGYISSGSALLPSGHGVSNTLSIGTLTLMPPSEGTSSASAAYTGMSTRLNETAKIVPSSASAVGSNSTMPTSWEAPLMTSAESTSSGLTSVVLTTPTINPTSTSSSSATVSVYSPENTLSVEEVEDDDYFYIPEIPACTPLHPEVVDLVHGGPGCEYKSCYPYLLVSRKSPWFDMQLMRRFYITPDSIQLFWDDVNWDEMDTSKCPLIEIPVNGPSGALDQTEEYVAQAEASKTNCLAWIRLPEDMLYRGSHESSQRLVKEDQEQATERSVPVSDTYYYGNETQQDLHLESQDSSLEFTARADTGAAPDNGMYGSSQHGGSAPLGSFMRDFAMMTMQHMNRTAFAEYCKRKEGAEKPKPVSTPSVLTGQITSEPQSTSALDKTVFPSSSTMVLVASTQEPLSSMSPSPYGSLSSGSTSFPAYSSGSLTQSSSASPPELPEIPDGSTRTQKSTYKTTRKASQQPSQQPSPEPQKPEDSQEQEEESSEDAGEDRAPIDLDGGEIAGIVIGSLVGVGGMAMGGTWAWPKHKPSVNMPKPLTAPVPPAPVPPPPVPPGAVPPPVPPGAPPPPPGAGPPPPRTEIEMQEALKEMWKGNPDWTTKDVDPKVLEQWKLDHPKPSRPPPDGTKQPKKMVQWLNEEAPPGAGEELGRKIRQKKKTPEEQLESRLERNRRLSESGLTKTNINPITNQVEYIGRIGKIGVHIGDQYGHVRTNRNGHQTMRWYKATKNGGLEDLEYGHNPFPQLDQVLAEELVNPGTFEKQSQGLTWTEYVKMLKQAPKDVGFHGSVPSLKPVYPPGNFVTNVPNTATPMVEISPEAVKNFQREDWKRIARLMRRFNEYSKFEFGAEAPQVADAELGGIMEGMEFGGNYRVPSQCVEFSGPVAEAGGNAMCQAGTERSIGKRCLPPSSMGDAWISNYFGTIPGTFQVPNMADLPIFPNASDLLPNATSGAQGGYKPGDSAAGSNMAQHPCSHWEGLCSCGPLRLFRPINLSNGLDMYPRTEACPERARVVLRRHPVILYGPGKWKNYWVTEHGVQDMSYGEDIVCPTDDACTPAFVQRSSPNKLPPLPGST